MTGRSIRRSLLVTGLAALCPVPVDVQVEVPVRPRSAVEAVAYFVVAEALTNVAKHSRASHAKVVVEGHGYPGTLTVMISDDGIGGADAHGPGLSGLADRVSGVDGQLRVDSPLGGPTVLTVELPCVDGLATGLRTNATPWVPPRVAPTPAPTPDGPGVEVAR